MKKLKKLKLVKEDLYHLNENELGNVIGGQCIGYSGDTLGQNCIGTYYCFTGNFCEPIIAVAVRMNIAVP